ncbi:unnamed protein product [Cuscuta campestris]|uniref:RING-type domain-containing protein n=1 Tax=Cuscuta campestris TaxID=132261 RepID=A0A484M0K5_9ASTE|nr:unnamed protein product [Cuscuta campestris]
MSTGGGPSLSWKLRKAAKKFLLRTCGGSFSRGRHSPVVVDTPIAAAASAFLDSPVVAEPASDSPPVTPSKFAPQSDSNSSNKNLCAICLEPLVFSSSNGQAIFTAQCSHAFHFDCISSNVRHGSVSCPICRALWTQIPRNLRATAHCSRGGDPILQILDESIATFRVNRRRSLLLSSPHYENDDPSTSGLPRLHFSLTTSPRANNRAACLSVKLARHRHPATDVVLVASPGGPHYVTLMKEAMARVVFALGPADRLAIVTHSSAEPRVFPLRRMTPYGKRDTLQLVDRIFYAEEVDPEEGVTEGAKILRDRTHRRNARTLMLHLSDGDEDDSARRPFGSGAVGPATHNFHVGFGFAMHEFEAFLGRILGGSVREVQVRVGEDSRIMRLGEIRGGEERRVPVNLGESGRIRVEYSYEEAEFGDSCVKTGEVAVGIPEKRECSEGGGSHRSTGGGVVERRPSSGVESSLEYYHHDPFMARRWAKHLLGYRG